MREGATRALVIAFAVSALLHAGALGFLPWIEEFPALIPPEPLPLIARVERFETPAPPPPKSAPARPRETRKAAPPPKPAPRSKPAPIVASVPQSAPAIALAPAPAPKPQSPPAPLIAAPARHPAPAPAPAAAPAPEALALERFRQGVIDQAARYKRYPRVAIDNGWEGEVRVRMSIGADGRVAALRVARGSGYEVLDRQALAMFRNAKPLVPIPGALRGRAFELELRAVFNLRDQRSG